MLWVIFLILCLLYLTSRLISPQYFWKKRNVFHVNLLYRLYVIFFERKSLAEQIRIAYEGFPDRRYYGSYQFLKPSLFVRDLDLIKQLTVKDFDHFSGHVDILGSKDNSILSKSLFTLKGKEWKDLRGTISPAFTTSKIKAMFVLISEASTKFVEHFEDHNQDLVEVEMKDAYSKYTNDIIATCAFGIKLDSLKEPDNEFISMGRSLTHFSPSRLIKTLLFLIFPAICKVLGIVVIPEKVINFFKRIISDTICLRETEGTYRPDLIQLLMEAKNGRLYDNYPTTTNDTGFATVEEMSDLEVKSTLQITEDVITAQAIIFFFAGLETTSSLLSFLSYELAKNPVIQNELIKEIDDNLVSTNLVISYEGISRMKYLDQVVSEGLRKWTSGYALNRICTKEYNIEPKNETEMPLTLPEGCYLLIPVIGIHHDPQYFENPDDFDPDRFNDERKRNIVPGSYMPFGCGQRSCIGSRFALLEIKAILVSMLSKFEFTFIEKTPVPLKLTKNVIMVAKGGLWLGLKRRVLQKNVKN